MNFYRGQEITETLISSTVSVLETIQSLHDANVYYKHFVYNDINSGERRPLEILLISKKFGVIVIRSFEQIEDRNSYIIDDYYEETCDDCIQVQKIISQNRQLRLGLSKIKIPIHGILVVNANICKDTSDVAIVNLSSLKDYIESLESNVSCLSEEDHKELLATIEGSKILQKNKSRVEIGKSALAKEAEKSITLFAQEQREFIYSYPINGFQILRGLAGSGKTVLLARKVAELHHNNPNAKIIYTFYTKSLYQTVINYIRSFYACLSPDNPEPNWENVKVMHAWGGNTNPGVYHEACLKSQISPLTYSQALQRKIVQNPFDTACENLLTNIKEKKIDPICDYTLIDEGQDFPISFIQICIKFTVGEKVIWAYDDLQTIFQENNPSAQVKQIGVDISDSKILEKCYRNPNEILICAHALGFGLYGEIIQTFENKSDWEKLGYQAEGDFIPGHKVTLTRPDSTVHHIWENPPSISEIIDAKIFDSLDDEIEDLVKLIKNDIEQGLKPEDILVICIKDHDAKKHAFLIEEKLLSCNIHVNNLQADMLSMYDFTTPNEVTISTVHKAKGNEAFQVYIVGIEAILANEVDKLQLIRSRNMLYTAMTRSKGWLTLLGVGENARKLQQELEKAKTLYPNIEFIYPAQEQLRLIKNNIKIAQAPEELLFSMQQLHKMLGDEAFEQLIENMKSVE